MKGIRRKKLRVVYLACLCLLAVVLQGTAMAARTIDSATLDTPANALYEGAKFQITLQVTTDGSGSANDWESTLVIFRPSAGPDVTVCLDQHGDETSSGTYTKTLQGPAPAAGTYTSVLVQAYDGDTCSAASPSAEFPITSDITVQATPTNPDLTTKCNKRIIILLDESGSIDDTLGATARSLVSSYLAALQGTNSEVAIIEFNNYSPLGFNLLGFAAPPYAPARLAIPYTQVTAANITNIFNPYLGPDVNITPDTSSYDPEDYPGYPTGYNVYTNWEAAFDAVAAYNNTAGVADLVLFLTDGTPTAWITDDMYITSNALPGFTATAVAHAATAALVVEAQGSHIFGIPLDGTSSNFAAITGPDVYDGTNFLIADYTDDAATGDIPADLGTCNTIPTMNEWGMMIFIVLAGLGAVYYLRRQRRVKN
jgi:hypothetical protein